MTEYPDGSTRSDPDFTQKAGIEEPHRRVLRRLDRLAWVLDSSIPIPLIRTRIGLDGLIGLVPGIGDAVSGMLSIYPVVEAGRLGIPGTTILRMLGNVLVDTLVGTIPLVGDLFDFAYKANRRNVELLRQRLRAGGVG